MFLEFVPMNSKSKRKEKPFNNLIRNSKRKVFFVVVSRYKIAAKQVPFLRILTIITNFLLGELRIFARKMGAHTAHKFDVPNEYNTNYKHTKNLIYIFT